MKLAYARAMEVLYIICVAIAGLSLTVMTLIIPWGVYTRYVLNRGSAWPEPMAVLLMIVFTFLGAAACYRSGAHIAVTMLVDRVPAGLQRIFRILVHLLMALLTVFMVYWGILLVQATWNQVIAEFPFLSTGISYMPIPIGGAITLLFIIEQMWVGPPGAGSLVHHEPQESTVN